MATTASAASAVAAAAAPTLLQSITATTSSAVSSNSTLFADGMWSSMPALAARGPRRRNANPRPIRMGRPGALRGGMVRAAAASAGGGGAATVKELSEQKVIHGKCFVVGDNIDTDQIIPAEYLTLVPSKPDEYEKLGSYAMIGLPAHYGKFIESGENKTQYAIIIGGRNFGCGSSREHAPVAMGAAGVRAVVAESYARIFFRNSVATGELYPLEAAVRLCEEIKTGDVLTVDMGKDLLIDHTSSKQFSLVPIGDAGPVIDAGGIFNYARATGMIASRAQT